MLIKSADDKTKRLALLEDLQKSPLLDLRNQMWLREELMRCGKGIQSEKDSAFNLESHFKGSENHVLPHDQHFVVDGEGGQIDHLVSGCNLAVRSYSAQPGNPSQPVGTFTVFKKGRGRCSAGRGHPDREPSEFQERGPQGGCRQHGYRDGSSLYLIDVRDCL